MDAHDQHDKRRNTFLIQVGVLVVALSLAWLLLWLLYGRIHVRTDDAYVHGNKLSLSAQIDSGVEVIFAEETNLVERGQLVVKLADEAYQLRYFQLLEELGKTVRQVSGYFYEADARSAYLDLARANLHQAELDLQHREGLAQAGAISIEEFEQYQTNVLIGLSNVEAAEKELDKAQARIENVTVETHPEVLEMVEKVKEAYYNLVRCNILAPMTGYVAKRRVQVGDFVKRGEPLLEIVPLDYLWAEANFKETKLKRIRVGQPVNFYADMHGRGVKYHGKVLGLSPGSGNAFAILPPENASGNWIKIIQRVPVRISIDPMELRENPLVLGVSLHVNVNSKDLEGSMVAQLPTLLPLYSTEIYRRQYEQIQEIMPQIAQVIAQNKY